MEREQKLNEVFTSDTLDCEMPKENRALKIETIFFFFFFFFVNSVCLVTVNSIEDCVGSTPYHHNNMSH